MSQAVRALYVHVPFCHTICGYCDFYSVVYDRRSAAPLVDAILDELRCVRERDDLSIETVFVGGGTPTTLPDEPLRRLLVELRALICTDAYEFTVEANPATIGPRTARTLAECGVNRVSLGAQSFDAAELRVLERIHDPAHIPQTLARLRTVGIDNVNLDLIFAIPGQTLAGWQTNLRQALELGVQHLSCYGLTYEPGTPLHERLQRGNVRRCDESLEAEMYEATIDELAAAGFEHYEISNFARAGMECRHNLTYWQNLPYLGIGPAAAGYVNGCRYRNAPDLAAYVRHPRDAWPPRSDMEHRDRAGEMRDTMMLGLRLIDGVEHAAFERRFGTTLRTEYCEPLERHRQAGLLVDDDRGVRLTRRGLLLADTVIADFL